MSGAVSMLTSFCPVICTSHMDETRSFYAGLFGFTAAHQTPWYTALVRHGRRQHELALLDHAHPSLPGPLRTPVRAVRLTLTVADGDGAWERLAAHGGVEVAGGDRRHVVVVDPNGVRLDVVAA
ncbi:VOC family protein [Streptomyces bikiniensis]|uniref:VOC family protein n=1 Tax=Streptomyces bikiniensis TaxID=1896 RepID=A0ABW8D2A4_STRBI